MATTIPGVLGPISTDDLGFTLMHEHVLIANWAMRQSFADYVDVPRFVEEAAAALRTVRERGVATMVDLTAINLGRDIHVIREVAERSGVQIIAATGFYWNEEPWMEAWDHETLARYLVRDLEEGIQGTDIRAGIIKCATDRHGVTDLNRKLLEVSARAHRRTGAPISTHTSVAERTGLAQQDVFEAEGVDLTRVVIGHCGDSEDLDYLEAILRRGSTIGMDRFGIDIILPTKQRVDTIAELCRRGWAEQMVLSHDASCHIDWFPKELVRAAAPNWNFLHIPDAVVPALRESGVSEAQIHQMTVDNPRRFFEQQGPY
jgi:phosphotriesterase-related protein